MAQKKYTLSATFSLLATFVLLLRQPLGGLPQLAKRNKQDCHTTDEMIADGIMQRNESCRQRLMGGDPVPATVEPRVETDDWKGSSLQDPWLVKTACTSPWNKWTLASE